MPSSPSRHCFLPEGSEALAYRDQPAGIGCGQTISQPYVIALMLEALDAETATPGA
ncbi:MAG: hypothetical protein U5N26_10680 [Candidatus Marinimicrobia bacterium]|nr:hypothetical protein [Candidatus Neomarinimicrobiota bacterium]